MQVNLEHEIGFEHFQVRKPFATVVLEREDAGGGLFTLHAVFGAVGVED